MSKEDVKDQGFKCWRKLISNFAINKQELNNKRRLTLLVIPLKAGNHATHRLCVSKMETWKYLLYNLDQESEMTVQLVIVHFLEFMFGGVGSLAPACKMLNTECGKAFWQLLKTLFVFRSLPDIFIKYAILCIEHIIENVDLALDIWKCLLNNMKLLQWPDNLVATLVTEIVNSGEKNAVFKKSETYAQLVRNLYTGNQSIPVGLLVKNIDKIITVAFEPDVLLNFTESWCNDLLEIVDQTDPITLPQDVMGIIVPKLIALSTGEVFR
ncbi:DNA-binding protein rif1 [Homalodisca vitripennis]|nr:DNA-binding protein rif1 [Homalodisca vitripennis]